MSLDEFVAEVFSLLRENPKAEEIAVNRVLPQRTAGFDRAAYERFFDAQNEKLFAARNKEWNEL